MQIRTERISLTEALAAASGELARYKEATGRSLETLEAERSTAAALATRSKAQVRSPNIWLPDQTRSPAPILLCLNCNHNCFTQGHEQTVLK